MTGSYSSSDSLVDSRFLPGDVLAGRYRIVGPIGRGGMGEVYRADDLRLSQSVALKFLPASLYADEGRLQKFFEEVRLARQVTHPNVCRVHDIEEHEGEHFLSMEYVDGEDLATLLRRIGRLPEDKAIQIARQICAGLAAAHMKGILHRDLKPANVMIDGKGQVRLTDFGLATLAAGVKPGDARAGTPAYMAPEQLDGTEVTTRSDVYSLGLVLYELFTGKTAFPADTLADMRRMQKESTPATPSSIVDIMDPAVERAILRCIEVDPRQRPSGPLAVAAALPGGDPLAAALAAGEIPSPEMVAAAGEEGALDPRLGLLCFMLVLAGLITTIYLSGVRVFARQVPLPKPPEALAVEARETIERLGYSDPPAHSVWGFSADGLWRRYVEENRPPASTRWDDVGTIRPAPIRFWYRQSPRYLVPANYVGFVTPNDPPSRMSGQIDVTLDPKGRLLEFLAVPPQEEAPRSDSLTPDWKPALEAAGLEASTLTESRPMRNPLINCDGQIAWEGAYPGQPEVPIRVEGCSYGERVAWFAVLPPWSRPTLMQPVEPRTLDWVMIVIAVIVCAALMGAALIMARRNLRLGRGDPRGAMRFALYLFALILAYLVLRIDHVPVLLSEIALLVTCVQLAMFYAVITWILYIALEPHVRRLWPDALISWSRMVSGRVRDPRVARDILLGALAGTIMSTGMLALNGLGTLLGGVGHPFADVVLDGLTDSRKLLGLIMAVVANSLLTPIMLFFMVLVLRVLLKRERPAVLVMLGILCLFGVLPTLAHVGALEGGARWAGILQIGIEFLACIVLWGMMLFVMIRLGLLALLALWLFTSSIGLVPLTFDASSWYFGRSALWILLLSLLAFWAWWDSRAGRPLLRGELLQP